MNDGHIELLTSPPWRTYLEEDVLPWILDELRPTGTARVLEVGPGPGLMTGLLRPHVGAHTVVEINSGLAGALRERYDHSEVEVICADATATELGDASFTAALCLTMLHHVPSVERQDMLLAEMCRLLEPGGRLLGLDSLDSPSLRAFHVDDTFVPLDLDTLPDRLAAAGFVQIVVEERDPPLRPGLKVRFSGTAAWSGDI
jgi:SAM-dependent methyltransferase